MDRLALELHHRIFELACTDDGTTGRSLSAVSRYIREAARPYLYQSLAVVGREQVDALVPRLLQTPPELRRIRYLFLANRPAEMFPPQGGAPCRCNSNQQEVYHRSENLVEYGCPRAPSLFATWSQFTNPLRGFQRQITSRLNRISGFAHEDGSSQREHSDTPEGLPAAFLLIELAAPSVQVLTIFPSCYGMDLYDDEYVTRLSLFSLPFPQLKALTCPYVFLSDDHSFLPNLRHLHLIPAGAMDYGRPTDPYSLKRCFPSITQLWVSRFSLHGNEFVTHLKQALEGPEEPRSSDNYTRRPFAVSPTHTPGPLPSGLLHIRVEHCEMTFSGWCGNGRAQQARRQRATLRMLHEMSSHHGGEVKVLVQKDNLGNEEFYASVHRHWAEGEDGQTCLMRHTST